MKLRLYSILLILVFSSCRKHYSCACDIVISGGGGTGKYSYSFNDTYSSVEPIEEKVTKRQAKDICKKTEQAILEVLASSRQYSNHSGQCAVK